MKKRNIIYIISIALLLLFLFMLFNVNILSLKYLITICMVLIGVNILGTIFVNLNKKIFKIIGTIILILSILGCSVGSYYLATANSFLDKSFNKKQIVYTNTYYVVGKKDSNYTKKNIKGEITYYKDTINIDKALEKLNKTYKTRGRSYDDIGKMFYDLEDNKNKFMLVEASSYGVVFELDKDLNRDDFKVLYKFDVKTLKKNNSSSKDSFNIYIGGNDFTNSLMDFNMIVSINMRTHEVLLTSLPRDYYVEVVGKNGRRDTLSYMGPYGIETSVKSLEKLFDVKIDYYVKVNTESLVGIVDQVGGITYCSDISYMTTHPLVLNTYNDHGKKLYVRKGCQELNGIETLTVARERNAFPGRDRVRQENCRKIMIAILNKLKSTNTITNYNQILNSLNDLYQTTIPRDVISQVAKDTINGAKWKISEQSVDGVDGIDYVHLTNLKDWVMYPNEDSVNSAKNKMKSILK